MKKLLFLVILGTVRLDGAVVGLQNLGATCYLNASLQCLFAIDAFRDFMLTHPRLFPANSIGAEYTQLMLGHISSSERSIRPQGFFNCIARNTLIAGVTTGQQHDAADFIEPFVDRIVADAPAAPKKDLEALFHNKLVSRIENSACNYNSPRVEPLGMLSLPLPEPRTGKMDTLLDLINNLSQPESVPFRVPGCDSPYSTKTLKMADFAAVVIIQLKRFSFNPFTGETAKLNFPIQIPLVVDFGQFLVKPQPGRNYDLVAVVAHQGHVDSGHYKAYVLYDNQWYACDDTNVKPLTSNELTGLLVSTQFTPYVLFYQKAGVKRNFAS